VSLPSRSPNDLPTVGKLRDVCNIAVFGAISKNFALRMDSKLGTDYEIRKREGNKHNAFLSKSLQTD
jgi:hypothetical protein